MPVYNCASSNLVSVTMGQVTDIGTCLAVDTPFDKMLWPPGGSPTLCVPMSYIRTILCQLLPAVLVDVALKLKGEKVFLVKIQRKIYEANKALTYFVTTNWHFKNDNFVALNDQMRLEDVSSFGFKDCFEYDVILFLRYAMLGVKRYLLGDKEENLPRNRIIYKRLKFLDRFLKFSLYAITFYFVFIKYDLLHVCKSFFN